MMESYLVRKRLIAREVVVVVTSTESGRSVVNGRSRTHDRRDDRVLDRWLDSC